MDKETRHLSCCCVVKACARYNGWSFKQLHCISFQSVIQVVIHSHFSHWSHWPALHPVCTQSTQKAVNGHMLNQNHFQLMYHLQPKIRFQTLVLLRQEARLLSMKPKSRHRFWVQVLNKIHLCLSALLQSLKCHAHHRHHPSQRLLESHQCNLEAPVHPRKPPLNHQHHLQ